MRAHLLPLPSPKLPGAILQPSACTSNWFSFSLVFHTASHSLVPSSFIPPHFHNIKMYFSFKIQFGFALFHTCVQPLKTFLGVWQHSQLLPVQLTSTPVNVLFAASSISLLKGLYKEHRSLRNTGNTMAFSNCYLCLWFFQMPLQCLLQS